MHTVFWRIFGRVNKQNFPISRQRLEIFCRSFSGPPGHLVDVRIFRYPGRIKMSRQVVCSVAGSGGDLVELRIFIHFTQADYLAPGDKRIIRYVSTFVRVQGTDQACSINLFYPHPADVALCPTHKQSHTPFLAVSHTPEGVFTLCDAWSFSGLTSKFHHWVQC